MIHVCKSKFVDERDYKASIQCESRTEMNLCFLKRKFTNLGIYAVAILTLGGIWEKLLSDPGSSCVFC